MACQKLSLILSNNEASNLGESFCQLKDFSDARLNRHHRIEQLELRVKHRKKRKIFSSLKLNLLRSNKTELQTLTKELDAFLGTKSDALNIIDG